MYPHRSDAYIAPGERRADVFTYSTLLSNLLRSGNEGGGPGSVMLLPSPHRSSARYFVSSRRVRARFSPKNARAASVLTPASWHKLALLIVFPCASSCATALVSRSRGVSCTMQAAFLLAA